jgi:hypothetical protein
MDVDVVHVLPSVGCKALLHTQCCLDDIPCAKAHSCRENLVQFESKSGGHPVMLFATNDKIILKDRKI